MKPFLIDLLFIILVVIVLLFAAPFSEQDDDFTTHPIESSETIDGYTALDLEDESMRPTP